jgi:CheY-like chemotaxis protein
MDRTTKTQPTPRFRALVLDGDPAAVGDLRRSLEAGCFSVLSAGDGTSGLALLLDELLGLDVLVLDLDLPGRDARSFANLVRRAGGERDLAIVVLASETTPALRGELLALGVDAVVDRSGGAESAAAAVQDAIEARRRSEAIEPEPTPAPVAPAPRAPDPRWTLAVRWSLLPA